MHPYRRNGYGLQSLKARLEIVSQNFGKTAWTLVNKNNHASASMVGKAGFVLAPEDKSVEEKYDLYTFTAYDD